MATECSACGQLVEDDARQCVCGRRLLEPPSAARSSLGLGSVLSDVGGVAVATAATGVLVWGLATAFDALDQHLILMTVVVPQWLTLGFLLRRYCYPHTPAAQIMRMGSVSAEDPIPAPLRYKLYLMLLTALQAGLAVTLAYVVISRTWQAARGAPPVTSLLEDLLRPWTVAPLFQAPMNPAAGNAQQPAVTPWWLWPLLAVIVFPFVTLAWCGTMVRRSELAAENRSPELAHDEVGWGRIFAGFALLFFWLPIFGLVFGLLAYVTNRHSVRWPRRASVWSLVAATIVHLALAALIIKDVMGH